MLLDDEHKSDDESFIFFLEKYLIYELSNSKATHSINANLFHLGIDLSSSKLK